MTIKEATDILRRHNLWRRYVGPIGEGPEMPDPKAVGDAIDVACEALEGQSKGPKSLVLTWQDIKRIVNIADDLLDANPHPASEEEYYTKVLDEFNLQHTKG